MHKNLTLTIEVCSSCSLESSKSSTSILTADSSDSFFAVPGTTGISGTKNSSEASSFVSSTNFWAAFSSDLSSTFGVIVEFSLLSSSSSSHRLIVAETGFDFLVVWQKVC